MGGGQGCFPAAAVPWHSCTQKDRSEAPGLRTRLGRRWQLLFSGIEQTAAGNIHERQLGEQFAL